MPTTSTEPPSPRTPSRGSPDAAIEEMTEPRKRLLEPLELVVFIDAIFVKVRDGEVSNRPMYAAI